MDVKNKHHLSNLQIGSFGPLVFKNTIDKWPSFHWTPEDLSDILGEMPLQCKISLIQPEDIQWEPDCLHLTITMKQYIDWLNDSQQGDNPLRLFDKSQFSCYIDYKYMKEMFEAQPDILKSVHWDDLGLKKRDGEHSTIWIGSSGAYTPCHQDTYGFNLVAQIQGRKRWYLFPPDQTDCMYPTRVPYEESSVYSEVNVRYPDLQKYPRFKKTTPYVIELVPGDVLYVPHHWWHFVECLEPAISINTWVPVVEDTESYLDEAISRLLYTCLSTTLLDDTKRSKYLNTGEELVDTDTNLEYVQKAVKSMLKMGNQGNRKSHSPTSSMDKTQVGNIAGEHDPCDNLEKIFAKFKNYSVTVAHLSGVNIGQNIENEKAENDSKLTGKAKNKRYDPDTVSEDVYIEEDMKYDKDSKRLKLDSNVYENDNSNTACEGCFNPVTDGAGGNRFASKHAETIGDRKIIGGVDGNEDDFLRDTEIFAAKLFTFTEFLNYLKIVFDYDVSIDETEVDSPSSSLSLLVKSSSSPSSSSFSRSSPSFRRPISTAIEGTENPSPSLSIPASIENTYIISANEMECSENTGRKPNRAPVDKNRECFDSEKISIDDVKDEYQESESERIKRMNYDIKDRESSEFSDSVDTSSKTGDELNRVQGFSDSAESVSRSKSELDRHQELVINTVDVINSILDPNVIRHISQVLMNKYRK